MASLVQHIPSHPIARNHLADFISSSGAVIGFREVEYRTNETDGMVEVDVILIEGMLSGPVEVVVVIATADDSAVGECSCCIMDYFRGVNFVM